MFVTLSFHGMQFDLYYLLSLCILIIHCWLKSVVFNKLISEQGLEVARPCLKRVMFGLLSFRITPPADRH